MIIRGTFEELAKEMTQEDIARIKAIRDEDIDLSEIPEITEDFFKGAVRGKFYLGSRQKQSQVKVKLEQEEEEI